MKKSKILVIDDEDDFQDIIRQILEPAGYEVISAGAGAAGLQSMRQDRPDLVVLDINMPIQDGYAVCREIRASDQFANMPILMLTIRNSDAEIIRGLDQGADDYLAKPFDHGELKTRIQHLLDRA